MNFKVASNELRFKLKNHFWMNESDIYSLNSKLLQLSVTIYLIFFIPIIAISLGRHFYLQQPWLEIWSFYPSDPPSFMVSNPEKHAFGIHYFGDFLLPASWGQYPNPFLKDVPVNYPPIAIEFISAFTSLGYKNGLFAFLSLMVLMSVITITFAIRKRSVLAIASGISTLGIASGPLLVAVDRGNVSGYSVGLLFLSGYFALKNQWRKAAVFIAIAASIKLYVVVLFVIFVFRRRWSDLLFGSLLSALLVFVPLSLYPGSFMMTLEGLLRGVSNFSIQSQDWILYCWNSSLVGGIYQLSVTFNLTAVSLMIYNNAQLLSLIFSLPIFYLIFRFRHCLWLAFILSFLLMSTLLPISYLYTLIWALSGLCLVFVRADQIDSGTLLSANVSSNFSDAVEKKENVLLFATTIYLTILLIPMSLALPQTSQFVCIQGIAPSIFLVSTISYLVYVAGSSRGNLVLKK